MTNLHNILDAMQRRAEGAKYRPAATTRSERISCGKFSGPAFSVRDRQGTLVFMVPREAGTPDDILQDVLNRIVRNDQGIPALIATVRELAGALEKIERGTEIPEGSSAAFMVGASIGSAANAIEIARAALASATKKLEELG